MTATRLCACCSALCLVLTAQSDPAKPRQTKKQEQKLRKELQGAYYTWITRDVAYIITDEERQAFKRLQNDEEREQFVEQFWLRRDPTPDTAEPLKMSSKRNTTAGSPTRMSISLPASRVGEPSADACTSRLDRRTKSKRIPRVDRISVRWSRGEGWELRFRSRPGAIVSSKALEPTSRSCLSIPR